MSSPNRSETCVLLQLPDNDHFSSRSSSFSSNDKKGPDKFRRAVSLEEVYLQHSERKINRKDCRRRRSTHLTSRKNSRKRHGSTKSNLRYEDNATFLLTYENEHGCSSKLSSKRTSSHLSSRRASGASSPHHKEFEKNIPKNDGRKKIVTTIIFAFCTLLLISVFSVIVTLTHTSTVMVMRDNVTVNITYYTFSHNPKILCTNRSDVLW